MTKFFMWQRFILVALLIVIGNSSFAQSKTNDEWPKQVMARLNSAKRPSFTGQAGTVKVGFALDRNGTLLSTWVIENSGIPALDAEALAFIEHAQPFPPAPAEEENFTFLLPVVFRPGLDDAAVRAKMQSVCRGC